MTMLGVHVEQHEDGEVEVTFAATPEEWGAATRMEAWIHELGWSIGPTEMSGMRGILAERDVSISKWRNLTIEQQEQCDAHSTGFGRSTWRKVVVKAGPAAETALASLAGRT